MKTILKSTSNWNNLPGVEYSDWSEWSDCQADCSLNPVQGEMTRKRTRIPNNWENAPLAFVESEVEVQRVPCPAKCPPGLKVCLFYVSNFPSQIVLWWTSEWVNWSPNLAIPVNTNWILSFRDQSIPRYHPLWWWVKVSIWIQASV